MISRTSMLHFGQEFPTRKSKSENKVYRGLTGHNVEIEREWTQQRLRNPKTKSSGVMRLFEKVVSRFC